jgi:hypothetical protein
MKRNRYVTAALAALTMGAILLAGTAPSQAASMSDSLPSIRDSKIIDGKFSFVDATDTVKVTNLSPPREGWGVGVRFWQSSNRSADAESQSCNVGPGLGRTKTCRLDFDGSRFVHYILYQYNSTRLTGNYKLGRLTNVTVDR